MKRFLAVVAGATLAVYFCVSNFADAQVPTSDRNHKSLNADGDSATGTYWRGTSCTDGTNVQAMSCNSSGELKVVAGTGASATEVQGTAADGAAVAGKPVLMGGQDGTNAQSIKTDSSGELQVDVLSIPALAAGTNNIGDVDVVTLPSLPSGTNNIGDVDVLTLPEFPAGTNNIGDVDVASIAAGDNNIGNVDVLSIAAGDNNIGDVDVASIAAGDNNIGNIDIVSGPTGASALQVNASAQTSSVQVERLVLNSASTTVPASALAGRRAIEIQNLGPNAIFCNVNGAAVVNKNRKISTDGSWAFDCSDTACAVQCIAATGDQVTGAATIVTELK